MRKTIEMSTDIETGKRIRIVREKHQLSQEKMAEILGIHSTTHYQNIEYGKSHVTALQLQILYQEFGASPNYILLGIVENKEEYIYDFLSRPAEERIKIYMEITKSAFGVQKCDFEIKLKNE